MTLSNTITTTMTSTSTFITKNNNKSNTTNQKKKKKTKQDPNGELKVARGVVQSSALSKQRREILLASKSLLDQHRIQSYLQDPNAEARMKILKQDDAEPTTNFLSDHQQRALHKRKRDKIVQANLERQETKRLDAAVAAVDAQLVLHTEMAGLIEPEHDMERTTKLSQTDLKYKYLEEQTAQHIYDLALSHHAPYGLKYDRSGSAAILYGRGGHVAMMNCQIGRASCRERV